MSTQCREAVERVMWSMLPQRAAPEPIGELNPLFEIAGVAHVMVTQAIAAIP